MAQPGLLHSLSVQTLRLAPVWPPRLGESSPVPLDPASPSSGSWPHWREVQTSSELEFTPVRATGSQQ